MRINVYARTIYPAGVLFLWRHDMIKEKYIIEPIDYKTAETVVVKCHYAHRKCSCVKSFGLFSKSPKRLVGVIIYGIPASPFVTLSRLLRGLEHMQFALYPAVVQPPSAGGELAVFPLETHIGGECGHAPAGTAPGQFAQLPRHRSWPALARSYGNATSQA